MLVMQAIKKKKCKKVLESLSADDLFDLSIFFAQAICYVLVRPLSKNFYRRINRVVAELLWLELVWLIDWWAGVKVFNQFSILCDIVLCY